MAAFRRKLLRVYHYPANIISWTLFAGVGLFLSVISALLLFAPSRDKIGLALRRMLRGLFSRWCFWLRATRLIYVDFHGFKAERMKGPAVYIANHPSLLDATFILSQLPDTICIFKPAIMRNPVLGPAAIMAGYSSGENGVDLIRDVVARIEAGRSLLIFPEGTRTLPGVSLNLLKPGFAVIAERARVPVRQILVRAPRDLVPKGWSWWRAPSFPAKVDITLLEEIVETNRTTASEVSDRAARRFVEELEMRHKE